MIAEKLNLSEQFECVGDTDNNDLTSIIVYKPNNSPSAVSFYEFALT